MKSGIGLQDIYIKILQETMVEVGNLWQRHEITVDKEHYCSAVTQGIMSQFYPMIFNSPRNGYKLLACCVGSELHELGIRMLADLFEYAGWDSIYLGAAVPTDAILHAIDENKPNLIALSVTMPHHLLMCRDLIDQIRHHHPNIKIVVG